jgi:hypothetical protein
VGRCRRCGAALTADELGEFLDELDEDEVAQVLEHLRLEVGAGGECEDED